VLLDADEGFHPYTTWSRCTTHNARELIEQFAPGASVVQIGVMRAHAVRHGPGPLPTEAEPARGLVSEHNQNNAWQGVVRYGWFDAMLMRYALRVTGGVDSLMVTHMDALSGQHAWTYCNGYRGLDPALASVTSPDGTAHELIVPRSLSLEERARVTDALAAVQPLLSACESNPEVVAATIERLLGHPVGMLSFGPSAGHVRLRGTNPIKG
jgi:adenylosuccinate synthase